MPQNFFATAELIVIALIHLLAYRFQLTVDRFKRASAYISRLYVIIYKRFNFAVSELWFIQV